METTYALNENETLQEIKRPPRIGFIKTFAGTTPPEGTLLCDGSAVSRNTYSELFAAIGTTWGEGDGSTTFNLPDLRDVWILCAGTEHEAGESVAEGLPNLYGDLTFRPFATGTYPDIEYASSVATGLSGVFSKTGASENPNSWTFAAAIGVSAPSSAGYAIGGEVVRFNAQNGNPIYGAQSHVTPASVAVLPCIVYE